MMLYLPLWVVVFVGSACMGRADLALEAFWLADAADRTAPTR